MRNGSSLIDLSPLIHRTGGYEAYEIIADQMQMLSSRNDEGEAEKPAAQRRAPEPACDSDVPF